MRWRSHCVVMSGLKLAELCPLPVWCWDCRCILAFLRYTFLKRYFYSCFSISQIVLLQAGGDTFPLIDNSGTVLGMVSGQKAVPCLDRVPTRPCHKAAQGSSCTHALRAGWTLFPAYPSTNQEMLCHILLCLPSPHVPPEDA